MKRNHVYFGFAVLFVLFMTTQTQARVQPNPNIGQNKGSKGIVFVNQRQLLKIANSRGVKVQAFKISRNDLAKLAASGSKGCGCALEEAAPGGWPCMKACLQDAGVSAGSVGICVGVCLAAGSGNLVGVWLCAICVGIADAIVFECSIKCSGLLTQNLAPKVPPKLRHGQTRGGNLAKLRLNSIRSASLR